VAQAAPNEEQLMRGLIFAMYLDDDADEAEVVAQLAELNAIPGVQVVPMVPSDLNDAVSE
jgi:hypothetical protein